MKTSSASTPNKNNNKLTKTDGVQSDKWNLSKTASDKTNIKEKCSSQPKLYRRENKNAEKEDKKKQQQQKM